MAADPKKTPAAAASASEFNSSDYGESPGGITVTQDSGWYKPEKCVTDDGKNVPIRGWIMRTQAYKSQKFGEGVALVFRVTRPTIMVDAENKRHRCEKGELLVNMGHGLTGLQAAADDEERISEVELMPTRREELANGHTLQHWKITMHNIVARSEVPTMDLASLQKALASAEPKALASAAS